MHYNNYDLNTLKAELITRFIGFLETAIQKKQYRVFHPENAWLEKKSILFLYPTVLQTYNTNYSQRINSLFQDDGMKQMVVFSELN